MRVRLSCKMKTVGERTRCLLKWPHYIANERLLCKKSDFLGVGLSSPSFRGSHAVLYYLFRGAALSYLRNFWAIAPRSTALLVFLFLHKVHKRTMGGISELHYFYNLKKKVSLNKRSKINQK